MYHGDYGGIGCTTMPLGTLQVGIPLTEHNNELGKRRIEYISGARQMEVHHEAGRKS